MGVFPHREAFTAEIWSTLDKYGVHVPSSENNRNTQVIFILINIFRLGFQSAHIAT